MLHRWEHHIIGKRQIYDNAMLRPELFSNSRNLAQSIWAISSSKAKLRKVNFNILTQSSDTTVESTERGHEILCVHDDYDSSVLTTLISKEKLMILLICR